VPTTTTGAAQGWTLRWQGRRRAGRMRRSNQKQRNNGAGRRRRLRRIQGAVQIDGGALSGSARPNVSIAGEAAPMTTVAEAVVCPLRSTATWEWAFPATLAGTIAVICPESTRINGAATPSNKTRVPASTVVIRFEESSCRRAGIGTDGGAE